MGNFKSSHKILFIHSMTSDITFYVIICEFDPVYFLESLLAIIKIN